MKKILCIFFSLFLFISIVSFAGCKKDDKVIKLNEVTHSIFYAPLYAAIELKYFEDEGLKIELTNGGGADKTMTAVLSKNADIGLMGPEAAIYVYNEGKTDYVQVFGQLTKRDGAFLVGRNPEPDFKWSNLTGKEIIAGRPGGVPAMTFEYLLKNNGLNDGQNITLNKAVDFNNMAAAFTGGTADYVALFEPVASSVAAEGKGYILASIGKDAGEVPYTAFQATKSYINKNGDKIEKFLKAIYKGMQYIKDNDSSAIANVLLPQFSGFTAAQIKVCIDNYKSIDAYMATPVMTEESFKKLQDIIESVNPDLLTKRVPFADLVYNDTAKKVVG